MAWGRRRGGSLCAWTRGVTAYLVTTWLNDDHLHMMLEKVVREIKEVRKEGSGLTCALTVAFSCLALRLVLLGPFLSMIPSWTGLV